MSNRQAMPGADAKTNTSQPAHSEPTKQAGARTGAKANGRPAGGGDTSQGATKGGDWRGEEVSSSKVASSAEDAASRAEGNGPVRAEAAARDPNPGTFTEKGPARRPRADDPDVAENEEEKRQSAAEEHAAQSSRHPPYGRL